MKEGHVHWAENQRARITQAVLESYLGSQTEGVEKFVSLVGFDLPASIFLPLPVR